MYTKGEKESYLATGIFFPLPPFSPHPVLKVLTFCTAQTRLFNITTFTMLKDLSVIYLLCLSFTCPNVIWFQVPSPLSRPLSKGSTISLCFSLKSDIGHCRWDGSVESCKRTTSLIFKALLLLMSSNNVSIFLLIMYIDSCQFCYQHKPQSFHVSPILDMIVPSALAPRFQMSIAPRYISVYCSKAFLLIEDISKR